MDGRDRRVMPNVSRQIRRGERRERGGRRGGAALHAAGGHEDRRKAHEPDRERNSVRLHLNLLGDGTSCACQSRRRLVLKSWERYGDSMVLLDSSTALGARDVRRIGMIQTWSSR